MNRADGAGERFAKGSSSKRSEGGEFFGAEELEGRLGTGAMGMAGGSAYCDVAAEAEWERCLGLGGGGDTTASDASAG